ncbi:MAG: short-chain dehydrogenase [Gammaproteobacteria bacterium]|nr:short-chain dehydrogenase [Gammaproteobacteria bacterium]RPG24175.1 MAG: SDR family oxidoreductase [Gammaproteobacteria bacterium TMED50]|tara:strand:+ start:1693 stop:2415 length:723 start_codon:yes stop_codon:yes gene_type:complete
MTHVAGQTIVITGAASGIGRAWVEGFCADGATVIAADINKEGLASLTSNGVYPMTCDVTVTEDIDAMIALAMERTGRVDAIFNNAGVAYGHSVEDSPPCAFEQHVAIHLFGCVYGMRAAIPIMRDQGRGRIINTISRQAEEARPRSSAYSAAKAAIWATSRAVAQEVSDANILVNMLIPGPTRTPIWGRDLPRLQPPEATYPTARMLATLPDDGPNGKVFWNEEEYPMFDPDNKPGSRSR